MYTEFPNLQHLCKKNFTQQPKFGQQTVLPEAPNTLDNSAYVINTKLCTHNRSHSKKNPATPKKKLKKIYKHSKKNVKTDEKKMRKDEKKSFLTTKGACFF
jgi:hypothetical protein